MIMSLAVIGVSIADASGFKETSVKLINRCDILLIAFP